MVGSSITEAERRAWSLVLRLGFVAVVAGSASLMALAGGATLAETGVIAGFGAVAGVGLLWYLTGLSVEPGGGRDRRRRR